MVSTMVKVEFGAPFNRQLDVAFNTTLTSARLSTVVNEAHVFDETTHKELDKDTFLVQHEMLVVLYHTVNVTGAVEGSWLVAHGKPMSIVHELDKLLKDKNMVYEATIIKDGDSYPFDVRDVVEQDVALHVELVEQEHSSSSGADASSASTSSSTTLWSSGNEEPSVVPAEDLEQVVVVVDENVAGDSKTLQTVRGELMALDSNLKVSNVEVALNSKGMVSLVFAGVQDLVAANNTVDLIREQRGSSKCSNVAESTDVLCHAVAAFVNDEFGLSWELRASVAHTATLHILAVCVALWLVHGW